MPLDNPQVGERWLLDTGAPWDPPKRVTVYDVAPGWVRYGFQGPDDLKWSLPTDLFLIAYRLEAPDAARPQTTPAP